jgi:site-specific recombinase XerD
VFDSGGVGFWDGWMQIPLTSSSGFFGPLSLYINPYLAQLREQGYAVGSLYEQVHILKLCDRWMKRTGREVRDLDEAAMRDCLRLVSRRGYGKNAGASTLRRLLAMLRQMGATPAAVTTLPSPAEQLTCAYARFLLRERNLSCKTAAWHRRFVSRFLCERFAHAQCNPSKLCAVDVAAFVQRHVKRGGPEEAKSLLAAMRSFLRYLHYKGLIDSDLSLAVPKVARWSFSTVPKNLSADQVREVLRHCDQSTALGRRDYAILLLLARLGLRAGEVVRLNLEDIDWESARITVRGKGGKWAQLPLPADVARVMARYLRRDRLRCTCRRVFIRDYAPVGGFNSSGAIARIVKRAITRAGVASARKGAHLLRHSLATDMLRKGASLDEIGEVLRHKSPDTTAIYAKVDINSLRALALPWPGGVR